MGGLAAVSSSSPQRVPVEISSSGSGSNSVTSSSPPSSPSRSSPNGGSGTGGLKTPPRMNAKGNLTPNRMRVNSRDFARSYSGLYAEENDLLPFEINRKQHTEWLESKVILLTYVAGIALFQIVATASLDGEVTGLFHNFEVSWSWTITNACHCLLTTIYLHWLKGSIFDDQGEMAALTLWEQLEGRRNTWTVKRILTLVPTLLAYFACHFANYEWHVCFVNVIIWIISITGKLPMMNGRRIFGINRTTGIDDTMNDTTMDGSTTDQKKNI